MITGNDVKTKTPTDTQDLMFFFLNIIAKLEASNCKALDCNHAVVQGKSKSDAVRKFTMYRETNANTTHMATLIR